MTSSNLIASAIGLASLAGALGTAHGHGRYPATDSVALDPGGDTVIVGTTFGTLVSRDGGEGWSWICDQAVGYDDDAEDPAYAVTASGAILAATTRGLAVSRDGGCDFAFAAGPLAGVWITDLAQAPDGALWLTTTSFDGPSDTYVSRDDAASFQSVGLASDRILWQSIGLAGAGRIYVSGLEQPADGEIAARAVTYVSDDGGATWQRRAAPGDTPSCDLLWADGDLVFGRVVRAGEQALYRSTDGALTWQEVLAVGGDARPELTAVAPVPGQPGHLVAGTRFAGVYRSTDSGATWQSAGFPTRLACARTDAGDPGGALWGCADNWTDDMALGRSTDGETWDPLLEWQDLGGALACPAGTAQHDVCEPRWFIVAEFLGLSGDDPGPDPAEPDDDIGDGGGGSCASVGLAWILALPWRRRSRGAPGWPCPPL